MLYPRATGQPEVVLGIRATVRPGNDMVNFQSPGHIRLGRATIPTPLRRGTADSRPQGGGERRRHYGSSGARRPRRTASARASDCRTQSCW